MWCGVSCLKNKFMTYPTYKQTMNIQSIINSIANLDREISSLESQLHTMSDNINRKIRETNATTEKFMQNIDLKKYGSYNNDITRKTEEISRLKKDKSAKAKILSEKQDKKLKLTQELSREEQKERDKTKRAQKEMLSIQQNITKEMELQKQRAINFIPLRQSVSSKIGNGKKYDAFISHASEDKISFVAPFVDALKSKDIAIWYDEFELQVGDSLRRSIDNGLRQSTYGIVVLSEAFFKKEWTQRELDGLFSRQVNGEEVILPIWHKISKNEVLSFSPMIADMMAINTTHFTIEEIADKIAKKIRR